MVTFPEDFQYIRQNLSSAMNFDFAQKVNPDLERLDFAKASEEMSIKALYFEMNEFDINTDCWNIDGFAYDKMEGLIRGIWTGSAVG